MLAKLKSLTREMGEKEKKGKKAKKAGAAAGSSVRQSTTESTPSLTIWHSDPEPRPLPIGPPITEIDDRPSGSYPPLTEVAEETPEVKAPPAPTASTTTQAPAQLKPTPVASPPAQQQPTPIASPPVQEPKPVASTFAPPPKAAVEEPAVVAVAPAAAVSPPPALAVPPAQTEPPKHVFPSPSMRTSEEEDRPSLDDDDGQVDAARMVAIVRLEGKREIDDLKGQIEELKAAIAKSSQEASSRVAAPSTTSAKDTTAREDVAAVKSELGMVRQLMDAMSDGLMRRMTAMEDAMADKKSAMRQKSDFGPSQQETLASSLIAEVLAKIEPGLEIAVQDSEKAMHEALNASGAIVDLKTETDKAVAKVDELSKGLVLVTEKMNGRMSSLDASVKDVWSPRGPSAKLTQKMDHMAEQMSAMFEQISNLTEGGQPSPSPRPARLDASNLFKQNDSEIRRSSTGYGASHPIEDDRQSMQSTCSARVLAQEWQIRKYQQRQVQEQRARDEARVSMQRMNSQAKSRFDEEEEDNSQRPLSRMASDKYQGPPGMDPTRRKSSGRPLAGEYIVSKDSYEPGDSRPIGNLPFSNSNNWDARSIRSSRSEMPNRGATSGRRQSRTGGSKGDTMRPL